MGIVSIIIGVNLYILFVGIFHRMFADRHGSGKAIFLGNLIVLGTLGLFFLLFS